MILMDEKLSSPELMYNNYFKQCLFEIFPFFPLILFKD